MASNNPHLINKQSLFALFCLSYLPLFFLLTVKILCANVDYLNYAGINCISVNLFLVKFGFIVILFLLSVYACIASKITFSNIFQKETSALPVTLTSIKPKNEDALSYLGSYVIPLLMKGEVGVFEYATFFVLFIIYYKLYSTSSLILINPILNLKYGLYEVEYKHSGKLQETPKKAMIISRQQWIEEEEELKLLKLSHRLYFAF